MEKISEKAILNADRIIELLDIELKNDGYVTDAMLETRKIIDDIASDITTEQLTEVLQVKDSQELKRNIHTYFNNHQNMYAEMVELSETLKNEGEEYDG